MERLLTLLKDEKGASAVEYGLLIALIAAVIIGAVKLLGENLKAAFDQITHIFSIP